MANLGEYLTQLEAAVTARGGVVHWARDADEANQIALDLVRASRPDVGSFQRARRPGEAYRLTASPVRRPHP